MCDLAQVDLATFDTVDALARLRLDAARLGLGVHLQGASAALKELLALAGLLERFDVGACVDSGVEARGQPEEREEPRGVQEEGDPGDPVA